MPPKARTDPAAQAKKFAALYVDGPPHIKGNWEAVEHALGAQFDSNDRTLRRAIEDEGGIPPAPLDVRPAAPPPAAEVMITLPTSDDPDEWRQAARELSQTWEGIAKGTIKASAAQVSIIKEIFKRAFDQVKTEAPIGVVVVPALGCNENMQVCPRCAAELTQIQNAGTT